ncbi:hypothetical protein BC628DRAFT_1392782, partial [Trametes gibbosa]
MVEDAEVTVRVGDRLFLKGEFGLAATADEEGSLDIADVENEVSDESVLLERAESSRCGRAVAPVVIGETGEGYITVTVPRSARESEVMPCIVEVEVSMLIWKKSNQNMVPVFCTRRVCSACGRALDCYSRARYLRWLTIGGTYLNGSPSSRV